MSIYLEATLGIGSNQIIFNRFSNPPDNVVFQTELRRPQQRDIRELDIPLPLESGISDYKTLLGEVNYVISGVMYPNDTTAHDIGVRKLRKVASLDVQQADPNTDRGYIPYVWTEYDGSQKQVFLKVLYVDIQEDIDNGFIKNFTLYCKIKDPTIFGTTQKIVTSQGSDPLTQSGTAIFPFSFPIVFGASTYSVSNSTTNNGDIPVNPQSIIVVGPANKPRITNKTTGEFIEVDVNIPSSSSQLLISYSKSQIKVELDGNSVLDKVSSGSTFFKIVEGVNEIELTASSLGGGSYYTLSYLEAYPL